MQEGLTSLILATQNGHLKVVEALLEASADPDITENVRFQTEYYIVLEMLVKCYMFTDCRVECSVLCRQVRLS